jgi:phage terminase large subunit-like protein
MKKYYQYAEDVINGTIIAGETIKLACKRFLSDLERDDLIFNESVVDDAIQFIGTLKHFTGRHSGNAFILEP